MRPDSSHILAVQNGRGGADQVRTAREEGSEGLASLPLRTAQLHLLFCLLLVAGVVLSRV